MKRAKFPTLPDHERQTAGVQTILAYYQQRLEYLREKNDSDASETATASLRGKIEEVKGLISNLGPDKQIDVKNRQPATVDAKPDTEEGEI